MGKKAVKQDLILKGLDPKTAVIGADGLWTAPPEAANVIVETTTEVAIAVETNEAESQELRNALVMPVESAKADKPKASKAKKAKEQKVVESTDETKPEAE